MKFISFNIKCFVFELYLVEYRSKKELQINAFCFYFCFTLLDSG